MTSTASDSLQADRGYFARLNSHFKYASAFALLLGALLLIVVPEWLEADRVTRTLLQTVGTVVLVTALSLLISIKLFGEQARAEAKEALNEVLVEHIRSDGEDRLRGFFHSEMEKLLEEFEHPSIIVGNRGELSNGLDLEQATHEVLAVYVSLGDTTVRRQLRRLLEERENVTLKVLLLDPFSDHVALRAQDMGTRLEERDLETRIGNTIAWLNNLKAGLPDDQRERLQVRGYEALPSYGMVCVDRQRAIIQWYMEGLDGNENLCVRVENTDATDRFFAELLHLFDQRWDRSREFVVLPPPVCDPPRPSIDEGRATFTLTFAEPIERETFRWESEPEIDDRDLDWEMDGDGAFTVLKVECSDLKDDEYEITLTCAAQTAPGEHKVLIKMDPIVLRRI